MQRNHTIPDGAGFMATTLLVMLLLLIGITTPARDGSHRSSRARTCSILPAGVEAASIAGNMLAGHSVRFVENRGQIVDDKGRARPDILYMADMEGSLAYVMRTGISLVHRRISALPSPVSEATGRSPVLREHMEKSLRVELARIDMQFLGSSKHVLVHAATPSAHYRNYYLAHCPEGIMRVPEFETVTYENLYEGIDCELLGSASGTMRLTFHVDVDAHPALIRLGILGTTDVSLDEHGDLCIRTPLGVQVLAAPHARTASGETVPCLYNLDEGTVGIELGDAALTQPVDITAWGSHIGGSHGEFLNGITSWGGDLIAFSGATTSTDYPAYKGYQMKNAGRTDSFISLNSRFRGIIWSTYIGGTEPDWAEAMVLGSNHTLCIAGYSYGDDFPRVNSKMPAGAYPGGFIVKVDSAGTVLLSTVLADAMFFGVAVDADDAIAFSGYTASDGFPVRNAIQPLLAGEQDLCVGKIRSDGELLWSTYFGSTGQDYGGGVDVDGAGNVYCTGFTFAEDFPTYRAYQPHSAGGEEWIVAKFTSTGNLIWSTCFGGSNAEEGYDIAVTPSGTCIAVGAVLSEDFPTRHAWRTQMKGFGDGGIIRFDSSGQLECATYIGGFGYFDFLTTVSCDAHGTIAVGGDTESTDYPLVAPLQSKCGGGRDAVFGLFSYSEEQGYKPEFLTYLGTAAGDRATAVSQLPGGELLVGGSTGGDLSVHPWIRNHNSGDQDAFIVRLSGLPTAIDASPAPDASHLHLDLPAPHPVTGDILIRFTLQHADDVSLRLHDVTGRRITTVLENSRLQAGTHVVQFDRGDLVPGLYILHLHGRRAATALRVIVR